MSFALRNVGRRAIGELASIVEGVRGNCEADKRTTIDPFES